MAAKYVNWMECLHRDEEKRVAVKKVRDRHRSQNTKSTPIIVYSNSIGNKSTPFLSEIYLGGFIKANKYS